MERKASKWDFFRSEVNYLGHLILHVAGEGVKPKPAKIAIMKDWLELTTVTFWVSQDFSEVHL